jgi:hypothetical protein
MHGVPHEKNGRRQCLKRSRQKGRDLSRACPVVQARRSGLGATKKKKLARDDGDRRKQGLTQRMSRASTTKSSEFLIPTKVAGQ